MTSIFGKGYSAENLELMRRFYNVYSHDQIGETVFTQFENLPEVSTGRKFYLSWSHYMKLMRIDNIDERHFYEIESVKNDWSLGELKRQYDSSFYERLALSTNKDNAVVEMTLPEDNTQIFASKYETILPSKEALQHILERWYSDAKKKIIVFNLLQSIATDLDNQDISFIKKHALIDRNDDEQFIRCFFYDITQDSEEVFELRMMFYEYYPEYAREWSIQEK